MEEIILYSEQLIAANNNWFQLAQQLNNYLSSFETILSYLTQAVNELNLLVNHPSTQPMESAVLAGNSNTSIQNIFSSQATVTDEKKDDVVESFINGSVEKITESAAKAILKHGDKVFGIMVKEGMKDVLADATGDIAGSVISGLGVDAGIAGVLGSVVQGLGVALAPEVFIPVMLGGYAVKKLFFDDDKEKMNVNNQIPGWITTQATVNGKVDYTEMMQNLTDEEYIRTYSVNRGRAISVGQSAKDFQHGRATTIRFSDEEMVRKFKKQYDPFNLEDWKYDGQEDYNGAKEHPGINPYRLWQKSALQTMESVYINQGERGDAYLDRMIASMRSNITSPLYRPMAESVINKFDAWRLERKQSSKQDIKGQTVSKPIIININKPLIEHFNINVKDVKESYPQIKTEVEKALLEIFDDIK